MSKLCFGLAAAIAFASVAGSAHAANVTLHHADLGWFDHRGRHTESSWNAFTGFAEGTGDFEYRGFFWFDISGLSGAVTGGSFSFKAAERESCVAYAFADSGCFGTDTGSETVGFFDVSEADLVPVAAAKSVTNDPGGLAVFADLGSGVSYGEVTVEAENRAVMPAVSFAFSDELISDLNKAVAAGETSFAIGAALTSKGSDGSVFEGFWLFSKPLEDSVALNVEYSDSVAAVPLPASLPLLIGGFASLGFAAKRKKRG